MKYLLIVMLFLFTTSCTGTVADNDTMAGNIANVLFLAANAAILAGL